MSKLDILLEKLEAIQKKDSAVYDTLLTFFVYSANEKLCWLKGIRWNDQGFFHEMHALEMEEKKDD